MGAFYRSKIKNKEINKKTGNVWSLEDVPSFWRSKAEKWIAENQQK